MRKWAVLIPAMLIGNPGTGIARATGAPRAIPADVRAFVVRRDNCDHFRGEDADDAQRQREIALNLRHYCTGTDRALARLKAKYRRDAHVRRLLSRYDPKVE